MNSFNKLYDKVLPIKEDKSLAEKSVDAFNAYLSTLDEEAIRAIHSIFPEKFDTTRHMAVMDMNVLTKAAVLALDSNKKKEEK